jgi:hypothetical protein
MPLSTLPSINSSLDHLVVAATQLDEAIYWARHTFGADAVRGGQHLTMGTHNALIKLSDQTYLELIAPDPALPAPAHPRWFGLSDPDTLHALRQRGPHLVSWVASTNDLNTANTVFGYAVQDFKRNQYRWQMGLPVQGTPHEGGAIPLLIQWKSVVHPCQALPAAHCRLVQLELSVQNPAETELLLESIHFHSERSVRLVISRGAPALRAIIDSPLGRIEI